MSHAHYMRQRRADGPSLRSILLPAAPLLAAFENVVIEPRSPVEKALWRARTSGAVTVAKADELCVNVLKRHPVDVYGEAWWA